MKNIVVYCGSSFGNDPLFRETAYNVGKAIAKRGYGLIYGGARVGLMGTVADGALAEGGQAIGVIPEFLQVKELEHKGLTENHIVETMHERKAMMAELGDGYIALPGGFGTMEELFEMLTWAQLALHNNPVAILNINGYYDLLLNFQNKMIEKGFLKEEYQSLLLVDDNIDNLLDRMENYVAPENDKWFVTQ